MIKDETFEMLYQQLASAWETHQRLRTSQSPFPNLDESSSRLHQARLAMWDWHHDQRVRVG